METRSVRRWPWPMLCGKWARMLLPIIVIVPPLSTNSCLAMKRVVNEIDESQVFDVGFVLDAGELKRAGGWIRERCQKLVNIDHHPYSRKFW